MEQEEYDYSIGLDTPYWIQEIRIKGKVWWTFQTPVSVSFIGIMFFTAVIMVLLTLPFMKILANVSIIPLTLWIVVPWRVGRLYVETDPDGKKIHYYLWGMMCYIKGFVLDSRGIYDGERRVKDKSKIIFEKTKL
ncbi:conjugal transfer protein [Pseudolactococcus paracarnosus]|uniref:Conjugal transfer protein n=1 Tax=Pseudolactococcus paracarnosus TaxID=2749962 RepID=A0ABT0AP19_9LACT|nr:conjugal transfer protein [Lactococcus paracarnosus]MCJ1978312.1 conjugal transfer protein [Lactococcus paracarnosus]MCJ1984471.1 conjugal transfer protein [Lactococcus paracarnosus]MCJ1999174.1 conjugal transfer protein [Lactococcus paracarnosus]